jgi:hypothetical protein
MNDAEPPSFIRPAVERATNLLEHALADEGWLD